MVTNRKFLYTLLFLFITPVLKAQDVSGNISPNEADLLIKSIGRAGADTSKINQLLKLATFYILKPGEYKSDLDQAANLVNKAQAINKKIGSEKAEGYICLTGAMMKREQGDVNGGKALINKSIPLLKQSKDNAHLGDAYRELSNYFDYTVEAELIQKTKAVEMAVSYFKKDGPSLKLAANLQFLADLYLIFVKLDQALETINLSLKTFQIFHYRELQGVYIIYSNIYTMRSDYKQAFKYGLMASKTAEDVQDSTMQRALIDNSNGVILSKMKEYKKAMSFYKNSLKIALRYSDHDAINLTAYNIVDAYINLGNYRAALKFMQSIPQKDLVTKSKNFSIYSTSAFCRLYTFLRQNSLAKPYADSLVKDFLVQTELIAPVLIQYFTASRQYGLAKQYLQKGIDDAELRNSEKPMLLQKYYKLSYKLDSTMGHFKSAFNGLNIYNRLKDSILDESKNKQLKQLEVEYETDKKVKEIKILNQNAQIQHTLLQKADLLKDITIGGIIVLVIFLGLLYRQYRLKQKGSLIIQQNNIRINDKNKLLEHLLKEKEWLLKEVHHRVKNNLHTVICLLESQAVYLENDALKAIENSQHRIYAMSLIHQKLYQSEDIKSIDMSLYLPEFVSYLSDSFGISRQIRFELDIEPLQLGVSQAIPLALIVNEAVTNAIKYAFKPANKGMIMIGLHQRESQITLIIADNGIGIDQELIRSSSGSLGLNLIKGLSEDIKGGVRIENRNGTRITIEFSPDPLSEMSNELDLVLHG